MLSTITHHVTSPICCMDMIMLGVFVLSVVVAPHARTSWSAARGSQVAAALTFDHRLAKRTKKIILDVV